MILPFIYYYFHTYIFVKIQTNFKVLDKYSFLISQKLVEIYFKNIKKNTTHISNIKKYYLINVENPNRTLR